MSTPARPRFALSLSWTLVGEVLYAAGQFAMLMVMARLGSATVLGQYALGLAIATPLFVLTSLHLRPAFVVASSTDGHGFGHYVALRLIGVPLSMVALAIWSFIAGYDPATGAMILTVGLVRCSDFISDVLQAAPARAEHLRYVGISRALRGVAVVASVASAMAAGLPPAWALGVGAVVGMLVTLLYDFPVARRYEPVRPRFEGRALWRLAWLTAPVGVAGAVLGLTQNMPAYVLEDVGSMEELGRYTAAVSVLFVSAMFNLAIGGAAVPRLARTFETSAQAFKRFLLKVVLVVAGLNTCILLGSIAVGELYLRIAYGAPMATLHGELVWAGVIAIAAGVANLLSQTVVSTRSFRTQFVVSLSGMVVALVLSLVLIPGRGLHGALLALGGVHLWRVTLYIITVLVITRARARSS